MARDHFWRRIFRGREREPHEPIGAPEDSDDVRYWTWGRDARTHARGGLGDLPDRDYGAFREHRPPWLGPSRGARIMRHIPQQPPPVGEVCAVKIMRPDPRILEDVCEALKTDGWIDATDIEVGVEDQIVTLRGEVSERNQKWLAEDLAERVLGVRGVVNRIRVGRRELEESPGRRAASTEAASARTTSNGTGTSSGEGDGGRARR